MKLILCNECQDIVKIATEEKRFCMCKRVWGRLDTTDPDCMRVIVSDTAIVLGIDNRTLRNAVINRPTVGWGGCFNTFVIAKQNEVVKVVEP